MRLHGFPVLVVSLTVTALLSAVLSAQPPGTIADEAEVPPYTLPDPLTLESGEPVDTARSWRVARRPELMRLFEREVYGRTPGPAPAVKATVTEESADALDGRAVRRQVTLRFSDRPDAPPLHLLIYLPSNGEGAVPVFLGLNFQGNHSIHDDPAIALATSWLPDRYPGVENNRATEAARGAAASRWPVNLILSRGYGLATAYYGDLDPDFDDGFANGVQPLFYRPGQTRPAGDEWGAIGAWAWGLSRAMDYLTEVPQIDARRVSIIGHSRLGKAALWAGAQDERFALVVSNNSGCGGAALSKRIFGETVAHITKSFPHWFAGRFTRYAGQEEKLPVDQHELLALIAPRPLYVASASEDLWADPKGEFLGALGAEPVYRLLGTEGLGVTEMPPVNTPVGKRIGYHLREGEHDVTAWDWEQYLAFADRELATPSRDR